MYIYIYVYVYTLFGSGGANLHRKFIEGDQGARIHQQLTKEFMVLAITESFLADVSTQIEYPAVAMDSHGTYLPWKFDMDHGGYPRNCPCWLESRC